MMSERRVVIEKTVSVGVGWTDIFSCAAALLAETTPQDVRWIHVERAKAIYDGMTELFNEKTTESHKGVR
jgi:ferredoxin-NADP reductase